MANGTRHAGATRGCGNGAWGGGSRIVNGPFGGHFCSHMTAVLVGLQAKISDSSILETHLCQNALELPQQEVITNTPERQVLGKGNNHGVRKLPVVRCFDAFGHEFLLDLSHPELQQSLRLGLVLLPFDLLPLLGLGGVPSQLLHERHDGQGQVLTRLRTESYSHLLVGNASQNRL